MSFIDEVRTDRQPLAHVLKKHHGIRKIVEDLYPDRAHFIYELLQNAEDTKATEAFFELEALKLTFEHNGRPFTEADILGITDIGEGTKVDDRDKIGRFGVGFKSVFAYSETPHIWSPTFSFKICDLVLPSEIHEKTSLGQKTRFEFTFDNPKKKHEDAYTEIKTGLGELAETTLLFLSNLQTIRWKIGSESFGEVHRIQHSENHIEIRTKVNAEQTNSHFLRFSARVQEMEKQHLSLAFELNFLTEGLAFDSEKPLAKQLRIIPAKRGLVAVYFPAQSESSNLRFHLHAPFVPELSRASIKDSPANGPLYEQLAKLAASSLSTIRKLNLLTVDFLGVLPNQQDRIPFRYECILTAILEAMNNHPLTPTHTKSHAPAKHLLRARAALKDLLNSADLEFLVDYQGAPSQWAAAAPQINSDADKFLSELAIREWDVDNFTRVLSLKASQEPFITWFEAKSGDWHQKMYSLFFLNIDKKKGAYRTTALSELKQIQIVRLDNGKHAVGSKSFFPTEGTEPDANFPRVDPKIYSSGENTTQQEEARKLLEHIGVREVGETEQIQAILDQRYKAESLYPDLKDLARFVALWEKGNHQSAVFQNYLIFKKTDGKWELPSRVYVDFPLQETGLSAYFSALGTNANKSALAHEYCQSVVPRGKLLEFAKAVGVQVCLEIVQADCSDNPAAPQLMQKAKGRKSRHGTNLDYNIPGIGDLLKQKNETLSRLVWKTVCDRKDTSWLLAKYCNNSHHDCQEVPSQMVCILSETAWIPQTDGRFVRPCEASRALLPEGFPYDAGYDWLKAVKFGESEPKGLQDEQIAKELGFANTESLGRARRFAALPPEAQERFLTEHEQKPLPEFPEKESRDPERRALNIATQVADAPERIVEERTRAVSVNLV